MYIFSEGFSEEPCRDNSFLSFACLSAEPIIRHEKELSCSSKYFSLRLWSLFELEMSVILL